MKKLILIILPLAIIGGVVFAIFSIYGAKKGVAAAQNKTFGRVNIMVTPEEISASKGITFKISLSNHSIPLSYDFKSIIKLTDNLGNSYSPISWQGEGEGTHHVNGEISFGPVKRGVKNISLEISGVDDVSNSFRFSM